MKKYALFLGWRYALGSRHERSISTMIAICFLGIFIGSFALALVASVMNGFEYVTHKKMQSIHSQIIMHADGQQLDPEKIGAVLQQEFPQVKSFSPRAEGHALIQDQETEDLHNIVVVKGIDPIREPTISSLEEKLTPKGKEKQTLTAVLSENNILVGKKLAHYADIYLNQPITLFIAPERSEIRGKKIKFKDKKAMVSATFKTGIDEFDAGVIFCSLDFFKKLFPESGVTQIGMQLHDDANQGKTIEALRKRFGLSVYSWKDLYPALVSALKLEKYAMFFILALITLVASMNIISLMFMQIARKRADIAILKAMGMPDADISYTFLCIGMLVAFFGSIFGLLFAFGAGWILETYPFINLPDAYYVSHLPSRMTVPIFLTVFIVVMILSFFSTWFSARRTRKINVSQVLRFEG